MAEYDGHVRIKLSLDNNGVANETKGVKAAFDRLGRDARAALSSVTFDNVKKDAAASSKAVGDVAREISGMSAAQAKVAASYAKKTAEIAKLTEQIKQGEAKAAAATQSLANRQATLEDSLRRTTAEADRLQREWNRLDAAVKRSRDGEILPGQDKKIAELDKLGRQMADLDDKARMYQRRIDETKAKIEQLNTVKVGETGGTQSGLKSKLEAAEVAAEALKRKLEEVDRAEKQTGKSGVASNIGKSLKQGLKNAGTSAKDVFKRIANYAKATGKRIIEYFKPMNKTLHHFGMLFKQAFVFGVVMQTLTKIREALADIAVKDAVINKQLLTIKGNLLAAFKPLWEAVYPAVVAILNAITMITSALANLSIKLFGDIGKNAKESTDLLAGEANAIGDVANAAKAASRELGTFDEINQISMSGGGGGSAGGVLASSAGLLTDLSWSFEDIYRRMMAINWEQVAARINSALLSIDFMRIGAAIRNGAQYIIGALNELLVGIEWDKLGNNIAAGLNELLVGDLLPDLAETLANWWNAKIGLFYGFVSTFDWSGFGESLAEGIETFFSTTNWDTAGESISNLVTGMLDTLVTTITETDWSVVGDAVLTMLTNIDWESIFLKFTEVVMAFGLKSMGKMIDGFADLFGIEEYPSFIGDSEEVLEGYGRSKALQPEMFDIEGVEELTLAFYEGRIEYHQFRDELGQTVGLDMTEAAVEIMSLRNKFKLGEISADEFSEALRGMGATEEQISAILATFGVVAEQNVESVSEMAIVNDELKISALAATTDIKLLSQALIDSGLSNDKARAAYAALQDALANNQSVEDYRLALEELGFTQSEIEALFVALGATTGDIATSMDVTAESVSDIAVDMDDAADAAEDMATAIETVSDNTEDAETAIEDESDALIDIASDADDATTAQGELTEATISLADATDTGATDMDSALAKNLFSWQTYAATLTAIMSNLKQEQIQFWSGFAPAAEQAARVMSAAFGSAASNIKSTFDGAWKSIINGLSNGGGSTFGAIADGVGAVLKRQLNSLINGLNSVLNNSFRQINGIFEKLRNTEVAGIKPFTAIKSISIPRIPALAKGAVIPANHEFLAILGDQKHGTNIEAPLDTIVQAMMIALDKSGATRGGATAAEIAAAMSGMAVKFDTVQVGRVVAEQIDANRRADGKFAYDLA